MNTNLRDTLISRLTTDDMHLSDDAARRLLHEYENAVRVQTLRETADEWEDHCPTHSDMEECFMDCPCEWAYELRTGANAYANEEETS